MELAPSHAARRLPGLPEHRPCPARRIRGELGFDYGKFDYGVVDGEVALYDVNRTPGAAADPSLHDETVEALAAGIRDYLGE